VSGAISGGSAATASAPPPRRSPQAGTSGRSWWAGKACRHSCKGRGNLHRRSRKSDANISPQAGGRHAKESWVITTAVGTGDEGSAGRRAAERAL